jgi:transposase-like protein
MAGIGPRKRDDALALTIASGQTLSEAAAATGIGERTARRRWADPAFRQRVKEMRAEMVSRAAARMGDGMVEAADVLRKLLKAKKEGVRLAACRAMLELGVRLRDAAEYEARLQALEADKDAAEAAAKESPKK